MKLRESLTPYALLGVLALSIGLGTGLGIAEAPSPSTGPITDQLVLGATRVSAGKEIHGVLVVGNPGGTINLTRVATVTVRRKIRLSGCMPGVGVGLGNSHYQQGVGFLLPCSGAPFLIRRGTTRIPVTILTTYVSCAQLDGTVTPSNPPCASSHGVLHAPPLPAGTYETRVDWSETVPIPTPKAVTVYVGRPRSPRDG